MRTTNYTHPGAILEEELQARGISQKDFADTISMSRTAFNDILKGRRHITADTAVLINAALGIPAKFWLRFQAQYDIYMSVEKQKERIHSIFQKISSSNKKNYNPELCLE